MKVSIITVVYNGEAFLETAIQSVRNQDYTDIEYIVIDGASKDGTPQILEKYRDQIDVLVSEPDQGIYDAMNKGVKRATGEIIGILNADDFYARQDVISRVVQEFREKQVDAVFGDLVFVKPENLDRVVRYYSSGNFKLAHFERADLPPHPTFFCKRELYEKYGHFRTDFRVVADFELMLRFLYIHKASFSHIQMVMVKMRMGGVSNEGIRSKLKLNKEMQRALKLNGINSSMLKIYSKYFTKIFQLVRRPKK